MTVAVSWARQITGSALLRSSSGTAMLNATPYDRVASRTSTTPNVVWSPPAQRWQVDQHDPGEADQQAEELPAARQAAGPADGDHRGEQGSGTVDQRSECGGDDLLPEAEQVERDRHPHQPQDGDQRPVRAPDAAVSGGYARQRQCPEDDPQPRHGAWVQVFQTDV